MRRSSAILLVALICLSLVSPAFAWKVENSLPNCCRRNVHHCRMPSSAGEERSGVALQQGRCPLYGEYGFAAPAGSAVPLAPAAALKLPHFREARMALLADSFRGSEPERANSKRGPPSV